MHIFAWYFRTAFDVIFSSSNKPLRIGVYFGLTVAALSLLMAIYNLVAYFCGIITLPGYTTTVFSIWFIGGLLMSQLGILGIYIGRIFDQVKGRPLFVVKDKVNL